MLNFRKKIVLSYVFVAVAILSLLFPFSQRAVKDLAFKAMDDRAVELIARLQDSADDNALVRDLKEERAVTFFRIAVITDERKVIYDSHTKKILGASFSQEYIVDHPEVLEAFRSGVSYHEEYSALLDQDLAYLARRFDFHGKHYVLRIAFPLQYVNEITRQFELGILGTATLVLLLFSLMTWFFIAYLTRPIKEILAAIKPYQEGLSDTVPEIDLKTTGRTDEFGTLASTLNSLSIRIGNQIRSLTRERNEKNSILESLVEGVIAVDSNMVVEYANPMALKILRLMPHEILHTPFIPEMQNTCYEMLYRCQEDNMIITETMELKEEGEKMYLNLVAAPIKEGSGAILILQDTTEHHKIIEMRKDFIANASHELKTPITIIRGFAETLHDNPDLGGDIYREITGKIVKNCERMTLIIKDLLTITDIERLPLSRLHECDLAEIVEGSVESARDAYPDVSIEIDRKNDRTFHANADPHLIDLAMINLLTNAAKYSNPPVKIVVKLDYEENWITISVADNGIGIPKEDIEHIFQRFYTVDKARSQKVGGSGLGLSIVETVAAKHFGKVTVKSELGSGSTFTIYLPSI